MSVITLDGLELWQEGYRFEFRAGGPDDLPEYVGADDDIPGASGMDPGQWRARSRLVRLRGVVIGAGADIEAQQISYRSRMDALIVKMDPNSLVDIVAYAPTFGVSGNWTLSNCRPLRTITEQAFGDMWWLGVLELTCIDSPPNWQVSGS
jgi:hypothetical protein